MTTTTEAPVNSATGETATTEPHRVIFSDPDAVRTTAVRDLETSGRAAQAPVFSNAY